MGLMIFLKITKKKSSQLSYKWMVIKNLKPMTNSEFNLNHQVIAFLAVLVQVWVLISKMITWAWNCTMKCQLKYKFLKINCKYVSRKFLFWTRTLKFFSLKQKWINKNKPNQIILKSKPNYNFNKYKKSS